MADSFGLSSAGLQIKTAAIVRDDLRAGIRSAWGASFDTSDGSPMGQLFAINAAVAGSLWALLEALYSGANRDAATGALLDALLLLTGTLRADAAFSSATLTLTGTTATVIPSGSRVRSASVTATIFETTADATLVMLTNWASTTAYVVDDRRTNASRSYVCITAGTSAGSGGPTTTSLDITDGTVHWRYLGEGAAVVDVTARCTVTGPVVAVANDLSIIDTPVGGWSNAVNLLDADVGRDVATDAEARVQGEEDLSRPGATTPDSIRQTLLAIVDVVSVTVFYNATDATVDSIPPHSVECLVRGGDDQDIFDSLFTDCIAAGVGSHGTETGAALDSEGVSHVVKFSRPTEITIWVVITLIKKAYSATDTTSYPVDGDAQVKAAIVAFGDLQLVGKNAVASQIGAQAFTVAGVFDVTTVYIDTANTPPVTSTTIPIGLRELAVFDTSRIVVNSSSGTP